MAVHNVALHILYGIPCVGKSTAAVEFAYHRNLRTIIHTDYVREVQRSYRSPEQAPALATVTHNAWQLHGPPTDPNIAAGFIDHVNAVSTGIKSVVNKLVSDGFDTVIEGAHFHSGIIDDLTTTYADAEIHATLLIVRTADELRHRIIEKEAVRAHGATPKHWQEHLPIMLVIQDFLVSDAQAHGIPVATADEWRNSWVRSHSDYSTSTTSS